MAELEQKFALISGDYKEIIFDAEGFDPTTADEILWYVNDEIEKTSADMDLTSNEIKFELTSEETKNYLGKYEFELKVKDVTGNISTVAKGIMIINSSLTIMV